MRRTSDEMELALDIGTRLPARPRAATMVDVAAVEASDSDLIVRTSTGDADAFERLYHRYARAIFGLALRRLGDRGRAEDAVQETFASVWRAAKSYKPERGPGAPWLYAVARNAITDRARSRLEPAADPPETASPEAGPLEQAEASWTSLRVHRALEDLAENERSVLELAYWSGLSQSEIADFLNIPLGTVKTRTRSALARLADVLEEELAS